MEAVGAASETSHLEGRVRNLAPAESCGSQSCLGPWGSWRGDLREAPGPSLWGRPTPGSGR